MDQKVLGLVIKAVFSFKKLYMKLFLKNNLNVFAILNQNIL